MFRVSTFVVLAIVCANIYAQQVKPCEPCDVSKCPVVKTRILLIFKGKKIIFFRLWIKNVSLV